MTFDPVAYLSALAISANYPRPSPLTKADAELLSRCVEELRRLKGIEAERKGERSC